MSNSEPTQEWQLPTMVSGEPPDLGKVVLEREFPSDEALVTPTVVRIMEFMVQEGLVVEDRRNQVGMCVEEALQNAVVHGNQQDFRKFVRAVIYLDDTQWTMRIDDQGEGFELGDVPDPREGEGLWGESGRGLSLMSLYMDEVKYYRDGRTLVISQHL